MDPGCGSPGLLDVPGGILRHGRHHRFRCRGRKDQIFRLPDLQCNYQRFNLRKKGVNILNGHDIYTLMGIVYGLAIVFIPERVYLLDILIILYP